MTTKPPKGSLAKYEPPMLDDIEMRASINYIFDDLEPQARVVLYDIACRLREGQKSYGRMNVVGDGRDYFYEAAEEALDFAVYAAMEKLKRRISR